MDALYKQLDALLYRAHATEGYSRNELRWLLVRECHKIYLQEDFSLRWALSNLDQEIDFAVSWIETHGEWSEEVTEIDLDATTPRLEDLAARLSDITASMVHEVGECLTAEWLSSLAMFQSMYFDLKDPEPYMPFQRMRLLSARRTKAAILAAYPDHPYPQRSKPS